MLNYKLLEYKKTVERNNETYIDLMTKTYDDKVLLQSTPIVVNKYYVARPDLISLAVYGDDRFGDIICKVNGISNPFELNENDILLIPNIEFLTDCIYKSRTEEAFIEDPKKDTIQKVDKYNMQKRKNENRSPNEQTIGESNFIIDKSLGMVFY